MSATIDGPIRAIETRYAGYRFRSRLEARWAVFFDTIGVKWTYENEGQRLANGVYLPDFEVCLASEFYVEVKGDLASPDLAKTVALCRERERHVLIFGNIPRPGLDGPDFFLLSPNTSDDAGYVELRAGFFWYVASTTGTRKISAQPLGWPTLIGDQPDLAARLQDLSEVDGFVRRPREVDEGFRAARSARFEHGETP